jgi:hypothetical protein
MHLLQQFILDEVRMGWEIQEQLHQTVDEELRIVTIRILEDTLIIPTMPSPHLTLAEPNSWF